MSWGDLQARNPELAAFGAERFSSGVAYLATVRKDNSPRVHPVTPIIGEGRLFVFMEPTSPKGHDLRRDGRYAQRAVESCVKCHTEHEDPDFDFDRDWEKIEH